MFDTNQDSYKRFRDIASERTTPIVAWVGSGLSVPAGGPTWLGLKEKLIHSLRAKATSIIDDTNQLKTKLNAIESQDNFWVAFEMIKESLGQATYRDTVREILLPTATAPIPNAYSHLWKLGVSGILNLNLDRLATRAYTDIFSGVAPPEFHGWQAANAAHVLKNPGKFMINLHGVVEDHRTWVLTQSELSSLTKKGGYKDLIRACLMTRTILFIGISVDDVAVGGHLEHLAKQQIDAGSHFWLSPRRDIETDRWAESVGIRIIRYEPGDKHSEIDEFFKDLTGFVPSDSIAPPVKLEEGTTSDRPLPPPNELVGKDADYIRQALNARAIKILQDSTNEAVANYERFSAEYDEAIYRAWYVTPKAPNNRLLGHEIVEQAGSGTFGTVYRAISPEGGQVAVKVLNQSIRSDPEMLQSFRRGVRSMRLLSQGNVEGMVPYLQASEIPAFVVMDWIEGPTLRRVVEAKLLRDWVDVLKIATEMSEIVQRAHALPSRVLHRDIRPDNVMLSEYWTEPEESKVVLLDFDLSWHTGATGESFVRGAQTTGYLAPEQMQPINGISTRSAAVDSFGLGMTLFFLISGRDPHPGEHLYTNWKDTVMSTAKNHGSNNWKSLSNRFGRLILNCTRSKQAERWDMSQISSELERLKEVALGDFHEIGTDILAEEIVSQLKVGKEYSWSDNSMSAEIILASGIRLIVAGNEPDQLVKVSIDWASHGVEMHKHLNRFMPEAMREATQILKSGGWRIMDEVIEYKAFRLTARIEKVILLEDITRASALLDKVTARLAF